MRRALCFAVLAVIAYTAVAEDPRSTAVDTVTWMENGARTSRTGVTVESAGYDEVAFASLGRRTKVAGSSVVEIRWGDSPAALADAQSALRRGDTDAALAGFDALLANRPTSRGWLVEHGSLGLGEALLAASRSDGRIAERAAHAFGTAREANPRSLDLDRILRGLSESELVRGRADAALEAAADLETVARAAKRPAWEADAILQRARVLERKGDSAGAMRAANQVLTLAGSKPVSPLPDTIQRLRRAALRASVLKTRVLVASAETARTSDAVRRARDAADEMEASGAEDSEVRAAAVNAAGALLLVAGDARGALRKFKEAEVLHFAVPEEAARALRYEAACYERLGDEKARQTALRTLAETYPGTDAARR